MPARAKIIGADLEPNSGARFGLLFDISTESRGLPTLAIGKMREELQRPWFFSVFRGLSALSEQQQCQLRRLVGLRKHGGAGLLEDLVADEVGGFLGNVDIGNL